MLSVSVPFHNRPCPTPARFSLRRFCPVALSRSKWIIATVILGVSIFLSGCGGEAPKGARKERKPKKTETRIEPSAKDQGQLPSPIPVVRRKLSVRFVDGVTGADIRPDKVLLSTKSEDKELSGNEAGSELLLDPGDYKIGVIAQGYRDYTGEVTAAAGNRFKVRFILDPLEDPAEVRKENLDSIRRHGYMILQGYVAAEDTGELLPDVAVSSGNTVKGTTDSKGFFRLQIPVGVVPSSATLRLKRAGFTTSVLERVGLWSAGDATYRFRLRRIKTPGIINPSVPPVLATNIPSTNGAGLGPTNELTFSNAAPATVEVTNVDMGTLIETNLPAMGTNDAASLELPGTEQASTNQESLTPPPPSQLTNVTALIPKTIRVLNSDGVTIDHLSMSRYEKSVLGAEWIPMWASYEGGTNSLNAGAVAVRCYAIWKINRSIRRQYDICGTAACQVYNPRRSFSAVDAAVDYTADWVLTFKGEIAHAEYSAENNSFDQENVTKFDCPDGFTSPKGGCLQDPICSGQDRYGHGRGMCQWGSARWATGRKMNGRISSDATTNGYPMKDWMWIVNHYYPEFTFLNLKTGEAPFVIISEAQQQVETGTAPGLTNAAGTNSVPEAQTNSVPTNSVPTNSVPTNSVTLPENPPVPEQKPASPEDGDNTESL